MTRIYKTEKFIPANGGDPVYQVHEETTVGSQVIRLDPRNPTPEELQHADEAFAASQQATITTIQSEKAALLSEKGTLLSEKSTLESQVTSLTTQVETLTAAKATAETSVVTLTEQLAAANARIASLLAGMPWNARVMEASAFIARISSQELLLLASSSDPMLQQIIGMLNQWKANDWPIVLDSPEIQQAVGYLAQQGVFAESRIAEVLRDCTQEESYVADE
jgi:septal ring factor EnvC (AmiA/AmiB activator)